LYIIQPALMAFMPIIDQKKQIKKKESLMANVRQTSGVCFRFSTPSAFLKQTKEIWSKAASKSKQNVTKTRSLFVILKWLECNNIYKFQSLKFQNHHKLFQVISLKYFSLNFKKQWSNKVSLLLHKLHLFRLSLSLHMLYLTNL